MRDYSKSLEWYVKAKLWTPGASQTMSKSPNRYPLRAHPACLKWGAGAHVWDIDGNEFIDWSLGLAAITLGYNNHDVDRAIQQQLLAGGISFSLPTELEAQVAERICGIFPCATNGAVRFVKTGSEADSAAVRIARRATGRDVVLACGYLGWHDWAMSRAKEHPGIPDLKLVSGEHFEYEISDPIQPFEVGEFPVCGYDIAAIIVEPPLFPPQNCDMAEWLTALEVFTRNAGALLIFDEVVTGGRFALGGAQEYFGVTPDLCTWGKGLANGMPLAGIAGPRELMKYADVISGTFGGETLSLAACNATLDVYQREPVIATMWARGEQFYRGLQELLSRHGLPAHMEGYAVHPRIVFTDREQSSPANILKSIWLQEMAEGGVLVHPGGWNVSYAHTPQDVADSLAAADKAFAVCKEALESGESRRWLRGKEITSGFKVR